MRIVVKDGTANVAAAIHDCKKSLAAASDEGDAGIILCSGGMSVDPDDNTPAAIRQTADEVVTYGAPVFPGAMIMLAYLARGTPVCGLPGCVMFAKTTIFDVLLPFLLAGKRLTQEDFARMGLGGLCLGCVECSFPVCSFGAFASKFSAL
jgi:molybdopterin biosynthesis enzyme